MEINSMSKEKYPIEPTGKEETIELVSIALGAIPQVGGVLSGIAINLIQKRQNRRLYKFLIDLANDLKSLQDQVNQEFMKSDEFEDLVEDIFTKASESRQQEKIDSYRAIFINTLLSETTAYNEAVEIALLVEGWQPKHIVLLKILANPLRADEDMGNPVGNGGGISTSINEILKRLLPDWDSDQIDRTWQELHDARIHNTLGTHTMITDRGIHQLEGRLTRFGQKVVRYLTNPAED